MAVPVLPKSPARRGSRRATWSCRPSSRVLWADSPHRREAVSSATRRSRKPSRTPKRRLALSGPHSTQASFRVSACAQSERSPMSSAKKPALARRAAAISRSHWREPPAATCATALDRSAAPAAAAGSQSGSRSRSPPPSRPRYPPVSACQEPIPPAFQDDVCVDQDGSTVSRHGRLIARPGRSTPCGRTGPQILDGKVEQIRSSAGRNPALVDRWPSTSMNGFENRGGRAILGASRRWARCFEARRQELSVLAPASSQSSATSRHFRAVAVTCKRHRRQH